MNTLDLVVEVLLVGLLFVSIVPFLQLLVIWEKEHLDVAGDRMVTMLLVKQLLLDRELLSSSSCNISPR